MITHNSNKMSREEAGRKGGLIRAQKYSGEELSQQAKKAAQTIEKAQPGFHARIGKEGGLKASHNTQID